MDGLIFIIFGITGDLAKRKLLPSLYQLFQKKVISDFIIIGAAIERVKVGQILEQIKPFIENFNQEVWKRFEQKLSYFQIDVKKSEQFENLANTIKEIEKNLNFKNRLIYCSTSWTFYAPIIKHCTQYKILEKQTDHKLQNWHRIALEKPFGKNFDSAKKLRSQIIKFVSEDQIFNVDHYLGKELIENIIFLRFANPIFSPIWNAKYIKSITLLLDESICIEDRGKFLDSIGALRDVVQNHMFQMLALTTMDLPRSLEPVQIQDAKAKLLKKINFVDGILGQVEGFKQEEGVASNSQTETFAFLELEIKEKKWRDVPIFLRTGKCLKEKITRVEINFRPINCSLINKHSAIENKLWINITPDPGFELKLNAKDPNSELSNPQAATVTMDFCYPCRWPNILQDYSVIFESIIENDRSIFISMEEILNSWKIMDKIRKHMSDNKLHIYQKGSEGPTWEKFKKHNKIC